VWLQDPNEEAPEFDVPGTEYKLRVMDNMADREVRTHCHWTMYTGYFTSLHFHYFILNSFVFPVVVSSLK